MRVYAVARMSRSDTHMGGMYTRGEHNYGITYQSMDLVKFSTKLKQLMAVLFEFQDDLYAYVCRCKNVEA